MERPHPLILAAALLTFAVVTLGAFVRLSNAGLGCPDWPGCYGHLTVPASLAEADALAHTRAWIEMIHRYAAGTLGLVILALAWLHRRQPAVRPLAFGLILLLGFQALLGMWTVTLKLMPLIVMGHLLGGMAILALLWLWHLRAPVQAPGQPSVPLRGLALVALGALVLQIALGGWTSANYAAAACPDLPTCHGQWWPEADFAAGFSLPEPMNASYEGGAHDSTARTAIHLTHRIGALVVLASVGLLAWRLMGRAGPLRRTGFVLAATLLLQFSLGLTNVMLQLPLSVAVAHTAGAALLLLALLAAVHATLPART